VCVCGGGRGVYETLNPELLPVAVSTVYECNVIVSRF